MNGVYTFEAQSNDDGFVKPGTNIRYEHEFINGDSELKTRKITLFRYTMRSQQKWWFLSEADDDQPGTNTDID